MASLINARMRSLAQGLVANEASATDSEKSDTPPAFRVCEKLREPLVTLAGPAGYVSLLSRALVLTKRDASGLNAVQIDADGSLEITSGDAAPDIQSATLLVANLLALLFHFVGEDITLRLLQDIVPDTSPKNSLGRKKNKP